MSSSYSYFDLCYFLDEAHMVEGVQDAQTSFSGFTIAGLHGLCYTQIDLFLQI